MSTVITFGAVILILAFLGMFLWSRWRLRTIGLVMVGIAILYVGAVFWFDDALDTALKNRAGLPDRFQASTNGKGGLKTNAP